MLSRAAQGETSLKRTDWAKTKLCHFAEERFLKSVKLPYFLRHGNEEYDPVFLRRVRIHPGINQNRLPSSVEALPSLSRNRTEMRFAEKMFEPVFNRISRRWRFFKAGTGSRPAERSRPEEKLVVNKPITWYYLGSNLGKANEPYAGLDKAWRYLVISPKLGETRKVDPKQSAQEDTTSTANCSTVEKCRAGTSLFGFQVVSGNCDRARTLNG